MKYDKDFAKICHWLKENGLVAKTDLKGRTMIAVKPERNIGQVRETADHWKPNVADYKSPRDI